MTQPIEVASDKLFNLRTGYRFYWQNKYLKELINRSMQKKEEIYSILDRMYTDKSYIDCAYEDLTKLMEAYADSKLKEERERIQSIANVMTINATSIHRTLGVIPTNKFLQALKDISKGSNK